MVGSLYLTNGIVNPKFPVDFTRRTKRMFNVRGEKFQVDDETKRLASILADKGVSGASIDANLIGFSQATYQFGLDGDEGAYVERLMKVFNITSSTCQLLIVGCRRNTLQLMTILS